MDVVVVVVVIVVLIVVVVSGVRQNGEQQLFKSTVMVAESSSHGEFGVDGGFFI